MIKAIGTKELLKIIGRQDYKVIDVRPADAYNGWQLKGELRGGHIKGARSLPAKWLNYIDWIEIVRRKDILPTTTLLYMVIRLRKRLNAAERFEKSGYDKGFCLQ
jgi:molybdopterin synthase sulfurtransferase